MPLTKDESDEACREICPHCKSAMPLRFREGTQEWTHDSNNKGAVVHALCWANGLRKSRFAEEAK